MPDDFLVKYCSPTLAGLKTGSLFSCEYDDKKELHADIRRFNKILTPRGLRMLPVKVSGKRALIYVYRPEKLSRDLTDADAREILCSFGYNACHVDLSVVRLIKRLRESEGFPHEIGLFLGYPPGDVRGFIENNGEGCKCVGCWKVYSNEEGAARLFEKYRKCTAIYSRKIAEGVSIKRLIVAG